MDTEFHSRGDLCESCSCALAAGEAVSNDADEMSAIGLSVCDIENMPNDPAHRRANGMKDAERSIGWLRHASEPAFVDEDGVAGAERRSGGDADADGSAGIGVGDDDEVASGAGRKAAGYGDGAFDRHVRHERILAGSRHLAKN